MPSTPIAVLVAGATGAIGRHFAQIISQQSSNVIRELVLLHRQETPPSLPGLDSLGKSSKVSIRWVHVSDDEWRLETEGKGTVLSSLFKETAFNVVFTGMGTSRANAEVAEAQAASGYAEGFRQFLNQVDLRQNVALGKRFLESSADKKGVFVRVSSFRADSSITGSEESPWGWYVHHQGKADDELRAAFEGKAQKLVLMKPGRLERGEDLRSKRPWEAQQFQQMGPGLDVEVVAKMSAATVLAEFEFNLEGTFDSAVLELASTKKANSQFEAYDGDELVELEAACKRNKRQKSDL
eukprot:TRINITY_DN25805_c0_g1_i1.p1 TRINITY_DN25805_c0_g1~~TRINITY_DN25805_c0_g1_i1.p1  ORF type:complete len:296 (-),score=71.91 TRINITY_DN25805_c0_g1_i1:99-986(-)